MQISIIIPTYNEEDVIAKTLKKIIDVSGHHVAEIIVADGGSTDSTCRYVKGFSEVKLITCSQFGRARQMNEGASAAKGEILFFLHADTIPPANFDKQIITQIDKGNKAGCFRLSFDYDHPLLQFYGWCTQFDIDAFRFGDQGLFISVEIFERIGRFRDDYLLMEDNEIVTRIKRDYSFKILPDSVITSARKYLRNGIIRLELTFMLIYTCYHLGCGQNFLKKIYNKLIK